MWNTLAFEKKLEDHLINEIGQEKGKAKYIEYASLRDRIIQDKALDAIDKVEPNLTDHGEVHVADVMNRVYKLLGDRPEHFLSHTEFYLLALMILFHDTGNVFGRDKHEETVSRIYNHFNKGEKRQERNLISKGVAAHGGVNSQGSKDTLKDLSNEENLTNEKIRLRELASILRFADELAEGPQRTSSFLKQHNLIAEKSMIHHEYSEITNIGIDRAGERIAITYNIDVEKSSFNEANMSELISFIHKRIQKLDIERRYTKNYSDLLSPFKTTTAEMNICVDGYLLDNLEIGRLQLGDSFPIPDTSIGERVVDIETHFSIEKIVQKITNFKKDNNGC